MADRIQPVTLAVSLLALLVSAFTFGASYLQTDRNEGLQRRPILVFQYDDASGWSLANVGNGPAVNVVVFGSPDGAMWSDPVRTPPIASGGQIPLAWIDVNVEKLGARYFDITDRSYHTVCDDDLNRFDDPGDAQGWPSNAPGAMWQRRRAPLANEPAAVP